MRPFAGSGIDGIDNGVNQWDVGDVPARYVVKTDLSSRVGNLNPRCALSSLCLSARMTGTPLPCELHAPACAHLNVHLNPEP